MRNGLLAGPLPVNLSLPYRDPIEKACEVGSGMSPFLVYAIGWRETIRVEQSGWLEAEWPGKTAATVITGGTADLPDLGYGIFQQTPSASGLPLPHDWQDPYVNALDAINNFISKAEAHWAAKGMQGHDLVRCIAASFNAGITGAERGHAIGNVDAYTTGCDYGTDVLLQYVRLQSGHKPQ